MNRLESSFDEAQVQAETTAGRELSEDTPVAESAIQDDAAFDQEAVYRLLLKYADETGRVETLLGSTRTPTSKPSSCRPHMRRPMAMAAWLTRPLLTQ